MDHEYLHHSSHTLKVCNTNCMIKQGRKPYSMFIGSVWEFQQRVDEKTHHLCNCLDTQPVVTI
jgi:hypothetical protein